MTGIRPDNPFALPQQPVDRSIRSDNPFLKPVQPDVDNDPGNQTFFHALGNLSKLLQKDMYPSDMYQSLKTNIQAIPEIGKNVRNSFESMMSVYTGQRFTKDSSGSITGVEDVPKEELASMQMGPVKAAGQTLAGMGSAILHPWETGVSKGGLSHLGGGLINDFLNKPFETIIAQVPDPTTGLLRPTTPIEQAQLLQHSIALGVSSAVGIGVSKVMAPDVAGQAGINFLAKNPIGNLARVLGGDLIGATAGGAAYSSVADLGKEDLGGRIIGTALSVLPVGALFSLLHDYSLIKEAKNEKADLIFNKHEAATIALVNESKLGSDESLASAIGKIQSFATDDDLLEAVVKSNLELGKGFIIPELSTERFAALQEKINPAKNLGTPIDWHPNVDVAERLDKVIVAKSGVRIQFLNDFDKAAYLSRKGGINSFSSAIVDDVLGSTEATLPEIMSHGKAVESYINEQLQAFSKGQGEAVKTGIIKVPSQLYNPEFARKTFDYHVYEGPGDESGSFKTVFISPKEIPQESANLFRETGFLPGQLVVDPYGFESVVIGGEGEFVRAKGFGDKQVETYQKDDLTYISNSFDSELHHIAGENVISHGILTPESWFDKLYEQFKGSTDDAKSFAQNFSVFTNKIGMTSRNDSEILARGFYKRIQEDLFETLDQDTRDAFTRAQKELFDYHKEASANEANQLYNNALSNEMYITAKGAGMYEIRSIVDNSLYGTAHSPLAAKKIINQGGRLKTVDLDGGNGNLIPPGAFAPSTSMMQPWQNGSEKIHFIDKLNLEFSKFIPPIKNLAASADAMWHTNLASKVVEPLDAAQNFLKTFLSKEATVLEDHYNNAIKTAKDLKVASADAPLISDLIETVLSKNARLTRTELVDKWINTDKMDRGRVGNLNAAADKLIKLYREGDSRFGIDYDTGRVIGNPNERDAFFNARSYIYAVAKEQRTIPLPAVDYHGEFSKVDPGNFPQFQSPEWFNKKITFNEAQRMAQKLLQKEIAKAGPEVPSGLMNFRGAFQKYLDSVKGIQDPEAQLSNSWRKTIKTLFPKAETLSALWLTSSQGGIPAYALRDYITGVGNVYVLYGEAFTAKFIKETVTGKYAKALMDQSEIPNVDGIQLLMPDADIKVGYSLMARNADFAMKLSGQHAVYAQQSAALYKLSLQDAAEGFNKLVRDVAKKEEVYKDLHFSSLPKGIATQIDDIISRGNPEAAAKMLARWRVKQLIGWYINHNNPVGWKGTYGRLLGQAGTWTTNQVQTVGDMMRGLEEKGSRAEAAGRLFRFTAFNSALLAGGGAVGLNLASWSTIPYMQVGGPVIRMATDAINAVQVLVSPDPNAQARGWNSIARVSPIQLHFDDEMGVEDYQVRLDQFYIPYGRQAENLLNSWRWASMGEGGNAVKQGVGLPVIGKPENVY